MQRFGRAIIFPRTHLRQPIWLHRIHYSTPASESQASSGMRWTTVAGLATTLSLGAYGFGSLYPLELGALISPRPAPSISFTDPDAYVEGLKRELERMPQLLKAREEAERQGEKDKWIEYRAYQYFSKEVAAHSLTASALRGPGKLALEPYYRTKMDGSEGYIFVHLGRAVCGHDGIVHGGLTATLLDEGLYRTGVLSLPSQVGVTANLTINYRAPVKAEQWVIVRTTLEEVKGRKVVVKGIMKDLKGTVLVEAKGIFVEPKDTRHLTVRNPSISKEPITKP